MRLKRAKNFLVKGLANENLHAFVGKTNEMWPIERKKERDRLG